MKHRERVLTALAHQQPDRCPMEMSFTPEFARRLREHLLGASGGHHNPHGGGNTYELEKALDLDVLLTSVGWANSYYAGDLYNPGQDSYTDEWGIGWKNVRYETRFGPGVYTEVCSHPIADENDLARYRPPDPHRPALYTEAQRVVEQYRGEYWICGSVQTTILETAIALRGFENLLMDLLDNLDFVEQLFDIPHQYHLAATRKLTELGVDMIWLGDDLGAQNSMFIDPALWRRILKPRLAAIIRELKGINPRLKIAYHTDGHVLPVIPDLIEAGVDVLHPVQPASMDVVMLKRQFGANLCFMGSVDEQHTLPFGSADDVRREVTARLATLGKNGGLIIGPTHHVQLDTPIENLLALVETVHGGS